MTENNNVVINEAAPVRSAKPEETYRERVEKMSQKHLRGELRRRGRSQFSERQHHGVILATVLLAVLDNTKTPNNPRGRLEPFIK